MATNLTPESVMSAIRISARNGLVENIQSILEDEMKDIVKEAAEQLVSSYEMRVDDMYNTFDNEHIVKILLEYKK